MEKDPESLGCLQPPKSTTDPRPPWQPCAHPHRRKWEAMDKAFMAKGQDSQRTRGNGHQPCQRPAIPALAENRAPGAWDTSSSQQSESDSSHIGPQPSKERVNNHTKASNCYAIYACFNLHYICIGILSVCVLILNMLLLNYFAKQTTKALNKHINTTTKN